MSKLPNAPLLEVIFEIRWKILDKNGLDKYQYLHGDLFAELKQEYPFRESLVNPEFPLEVFINKPMYRFRTKEAGYPLYQVGPGIISLNTIDEEYRWENFYERAEQLISSFFEVFTFSEDDQIDLGLIYVDFFRLDFNHENVHDFINNNLNIKISQGFYETEERPKNISLSFDYETSFGELKVFLRKGKNIKKEEGVIMHTTVVGKEKSPNQETILSWLNQTHEFCSQLFKDITKEELYNSFK